MDKTTVIFNSSTPSVLLLKAAFSEFDLIENAFADASQFQISSFSHRNNNRHLSSNIAKWILGVVGLLEAICAISFNCFVIVGMAIVLRRRKCFANRGSLSRANLGNLTMPSYVITLAIVDLLMVVLNISYIIFTLAEEHFPTTLQLDSIACYIREPIINSSVGISTSLMLAIAYQRYKHIVGHQSMPSASTNSLNSVETNNNLQRRFSTLSLSQTVCPSEHESLKRTILTIVSIVLFNALLSLPAVYHVQLIPVKYHFPVVMQKAFKNETFDLKTDFRYEQFVVTSLCLQWWESPALFIVYSLIDFGFTFFIPVMVTFLLYSSIACRLARSSRLSGLAISRKRASKTTKLLGFAVVAFTVCWSPYKLLSLAIDLRTSGISSASDEEFKDSLLANGENNAILVLSLKLLALLQTCINPILYGLRMLAPVRKEQRRLSQLHIPSQAELMLRRVSKPILVLPDTEDNASNSISLGVNGTSSRRPSRVTFRDFDDNSITLNEAVNSSSSGAGAGCGPLLMVDNATSLSPAESSATDDSVNFALTVPSLVQITV